MSDTKSTTFQFGAYTLHVESRELRHKGALVSTEPKVFDLLVHLLRHRDRVVSKDELLNTVWPRSVVSETALTRCVMKARRVVGDHADHQHTIKTLHGRGYRFVGEAHIAPATQGETAAAPRPSNGRLPQLLLATAFILLIGIVLLVDLPGPTDRNGPRSTGGPRFAVLPIENRSGDPTLDWTTYGLMDALAKELRTNGGLKVMDSRDVLRVVHRPLTAPDPDLDAATEPAGANGRSGAEADSAAAPLRSRAPALARLRAEYGASHIVSAILDQPGERFRLRVSLVIDGQRAQDTELMGTNPVAMISELRRALADQTAPYRRAESSAQRVSEDAFVNEAYARGRERVLRGDLDEAVTLLRVAVDQEPDNHWTRHALATALLNRGEATQAQEMLTALVEEAAREERPLARASSLHVLGNTHLRMQNFDAAEDTYRDALLAFDRLGLSFERGKVLSNLSIIVGERGDLTQERALLEQAALAFEEAGVTATPGNVLGGLANNALDRGHLEDAQVYFEQALQRFREQGRKDLTAVSLYSLSRVAQYRGEFGRSRALAEESLTLTQEIANQWGAQAALKRLGQATLASGDLAGAARTFREAQALAQEIGAPTSVASALADQAEVARLQGDLTTALACLTRADEIVAQTEDVIGARNLQLLRGRIALASAEPAEAMRLADEVLTAVAGENPPSDLVVNAHELRGLALLATADLDAAASSLERAYAVAEFRSDRVKRAQLAAALGRLALDRGAPETATGYLGLARDAAPSVYEVFALRAAIASEHNDHVDALALITEAKARAGGRWDAAHERLLHAITRRAPQSEAAADAPPAIPSATDGA